MTTMYFKKSPFLIYFYFILVENVKSSVFDEDLYKRVLDPEECDRQLQFLSNDSLIMQFIDSSGKIPPGIMKGNLNDLGDYYQCLGIHETRDNMSIEGKYCSVSIPFEQDPVDQLLESGHEAKEALRRKINLRDNLIKIFGINLQRQRPGLRIGASLTPTLDLKVAVCLPKVCTIKQAVDTILNRLIFLNVTYTENSCRLPNDKPLVAADYVAISIISVIGFITLGSTSYDLYRTFILKSCPSEANTVLRSFSVYTNSRRFLTFPSSPGALGCLDGIRAISMLWVIIGHTFIMTLNAPLHNILEALQWMQSFSSVWLTSAPISVDTFFFLSGVLCVYSTIAKIGRSTFIRNIPLFWLHRLLRMFPLLATMVLLQASLLNHVTDGPSWGGVGVSTESCRQNWWAALLHIQNYYNLTGMCLNQTWYLSVDVQLYMASPVVLIWLFEGRRRAWIALTTSIAASFISTSIYSFKYNFPSSLINFSRIAQLLDYFEHYYVNTLTRAPPFCVGMLFGYLLHLCRDTRVRIQKRYSIALWMTSFTVMLFAILVNYPVAQPDHDSQILDNLLNAYMRGIWALAMGWLVFACVHGYAGPINWFLSLQMWKLPARLSYAMYLVHFSILFLEGGSYVKTHYFTVGETIFRFMAVLSLTSLSSLVLCVLVDAPCSTLLKILLEGGRKTKKLESLESIVQVE